MTHRSPYRGFSVLQHRWEPRIVKTSHGAYMAYIEFIWNSIYLNTKLVDFDSPHIIHNSIVYKIRITPNTPTLYIHLMPSGMSPVQACPKLVRVYSRRCVFRNVYSLSIQEEGDGVDYGFGILLV